MSVFSFSVFRLAAKETNMQIVYSRCCGVDVHKNSVTACVLVRDGDGSRPVRVKQFDAHAAGLQRLRLWL